MFALENKNTSLITSLVFTVINFTERFNLLCAKVLEFVFCKCSLFSNYFIRHYANFNKLVLRHFNNLSNSLTFTYHRLNYI